VNFNQQMLARLVLLVALISVNTQAQQNSPSTTGDRTIVQKADAKINALRGTTKR
jgi:hypothetical protein